jgi:hypothetical protein
MAVLALAALAAGCAPLPQPPQPAPERHAARHENGPGALREADMNRRWQNQPLSELVAALGRPARVMNIPGGGSPPGFVVVYGVDAATGCIDAFALMYAVDPIVRVYHCR